MGVVGVSEPNPLWQAIEDLRECDETQGGVLRALRIMAGMVLTLKERLDNVEDYLQPPEERPHG